MLFECRNWYHRCAECNIGNVEPDVVQLGFFCRDNLRYILFLVIFFIHGFVNRSDLGDSECFALVGDMGAVIGICTLGGCATGSILGSNAAGWVIIVSYGF